MRVWSLTSLALFALTAPGVAFAQRSPLTWSAPRGCPSSEEVIARARAAGLRDTASEWTAEATVRHSSNGLWRLAMNITVSGDRVPASRSAPTCADLAQVAGVDLALVINAYSEPPAPPPPPPPPPPLPIATPPTPERDAEPAGPPRDPSAMPARAWRVALAALAAMDVGALPTGNVGFGARAGLQWTYAGVSLTALYFPTVGTDAGEGPFRARPESVAYVSAWTVSARACGRLASSAWSVDGCLGVELGVRNVAASASVNRGVASGALWFAPLVAVEGAWHPLRWLSVAVGSDVSLPVPALPFVRVDNVGVVLDPWVVRVVPHLAVGLSL